MSASMFAIGDSLREARMRRGLSAADVQKGIRIRERYLTALEEEHWELLPGDAYTKGFLRTYAEFLGLDGNLYIDEYNTRLSHATGEQPLVPHSLVAVRRGRRGLLRTLLALLAIGALTAGFAALGMTGPSSSQARDTTPASHRVRHVVKAAPAVPAAPAPAAVRLATTTVISAARGRCWLAVHAAGPGGAILYQGVLERGKALHFALGHSLWLRMGRPANLDISLGGRLVGGLPARAGNLLLTPSGAKSA